MVFEDILNSVTPCSRVAWMILGDLPGWSKAFCNYNRCQLNEQFNIGADGSSHNTLIVCGCKHKRSTKKHFTTFIISQRVHILFSHLPNQFKTVIIWKIGQLNLFQFSPSRWQSYLEMDSKHVDWDVSKNILLTEILLLPYF